MRIFDDENNFGAVITGEILEIKNANSEPLIPPKIAENSTPIIDLEEFDDLFEKLKEAYEGNTVNADDNWAFANCAINIIGESEAESDQRELVKLLENDAAKSTDEWGFLSKTMNIIGESDAESEQLKLEEMLEARIIAILDKPWDLNETTAVNPIQAYSQDVRNDTPLPQEEIAELVFKWQKYGDKSARTRMVQHNLRLVISIAKQYYHPDIGLELTDLISDGNIGLMKSIDKFDPTRGFKFSTYAVWWIKQAISRSIAVTSTTIRVPENIFNAAKKIKRLQNNAMQKLDREYNLDELAGKMNMSIEKITRIIEMTAPISSLDTHATKSEQCPSLVETICDTEDTPDKKYIKSALCEDFIKILSHLTEIEQEVLVCRFGFENEEPESSAKTAARLGISKSRVYQIEISALEKIRKNPKAMEQLADYRS